MNPQVVLKLYFNDTLYHMPFWRTLSIFGLVFLWKTVIPVRKSFLIGQLENK